MSRSLLPQCFAANCDETFESVNEMVAVPGRGDRSPRHFCERCAESIRRGPPMTDGGSDESVDCDLCGRDGCTTLKPRFHTGWQKTIDACDMCRNDCDFLVRSNE